MCKVKYFICPMSTQIIDAVIEMEDERLGLLPSRRQVDYDNGYVMNTKNFFNYVRSKSNIIIERDHGGANQGTIIGDEYKSYEFDSGHMDIIHIDPWKRYTNLQEGLFETIRNIEFIYYNNKKIQFEIGTEQSIRPFTINEMTEFVEGLDSKLSPLIFEQVQYFCIQSGVGLDIVNKRNIGIFSEDRMKQMIDIAKTYNKKTKEHNGDYLCEGEYRYRFENGLDSINIGPEIAQIQTASYLEIMTPSEMDDFYNICLESGRFEKWVDSDFDITDKEKLIMVCGHYNFKKLDIQFNNLSSTDDIDTIIKEKIKNKLTELLSYV